MLVMPASYVDELSQKKYGLLRPLIELRFGSCENKPLPLLYLGYGSIMHFVTELLKKKTKLSFMKTLLSYLTENT
jgi:hypothetical protein